MTSSFTDDDGYRYEQFVPGGPFIKSEQPVQPPAPDAAASRELQEWWEPYPHLWKILDSTGFPSCEVDYYQLVEFIKMVIVAAVQAEKRLLLDFLENKLLDKSVALTNEDTAVLWDDIKALLDSEQQKLGGK